MIFSRFFVESFTWESPFEKDDNFSLGGALRSPDDNFTLFCYFRGSSSLHETLFNVLNLVLLVVIDQIHSSCFQHMQCSFNFLKLELFFIKCRCKTRQILSPFTINFVMALYWFLKFHLTSISTKNNFKKWVLCKNCTKVIKTYIDFSSTMTFSTDSFIII